MGLGHPQEVSEAVCGARRRRSRNASCLTEGRKGRGASQGRRSAWAKLQTAEAGSRVGARRGCSGTGAAGGSGRAVGSATPLGGGAPQAGRLGTGRPRCWQSGGGAARLRMGWEPRPQAAEGAGARAEPELRHPGASEHLRAAPRARGGSAVPGPGAGRGRAGGRGHGARLGRARGHVAEAPPPAACERPSVRSGSLLAGRGAGSGDPEQHLGGKERQEVLGCSLGHGGEWWP